jgi:hypothetical protein
MGEELNKHRVLIRKPEWKRLIEIPGRRHGRIVIKLIKGE